MYFKNCYYIELKQKNLNANNNISSIIALFKRNKFNYSSNLIRKEKAINETSLKFDSSFKKDLEFNKENLSNTTASIILNKTPSKRKLNEEIIEDFPSNFVQKNENIIPVYHSSLLINKKQIRNEKTPNLKKKEKLSNSSNNKNIDKIKFDENKSVLTLNIVYENEVIFEYFPILNISLKRK